MTFLDPTDPSSTTGPSEAGPDRADQSTVAPSDQVAGQPPVWAPVPPDPSPPTVPLPQAGLELYPAPPAVPGPPGYQPYPPPPPGYPAYPPPAYQAPPPADQASPPTAFPPPTLQPGYQPYAPPAFQPYQWPGHPPAQAFIPYPVLPAFGVDPYGRPMSDKSKVAAGLLQLLLGFFLSIGGVGRLYAGNTTIGTVQLAATVIAWVSFLCGFVLIFPWIFSIGLWLWFVIDGIVMLVGQPKDGEGRLLRP